MSFTLGALTMEQTKHLTAADAGALAGLTRLPSLRTWRQRLGELADRCDPLALQRRLASQMLAIEPAESQVYLADDHLAEYTGHQPVALGRNPRRGKPTKGHDDTYVCDLAGRAISFTTGEPSALCSTLPGALAALTAALPARDKPGPGTKPLIVFDRGAAFPSTFTEVDAAGYDWLTWRRAPLAATAHLPILQTITLRGHREREMAFTDELTALKDYGKPVRQLSLFEHGKMVAQAISGRLDACPAELIGWLRGRWAEENMFKYDMASYGLDMLADYLADEVVNTKLKANPAATRARKAETKAKTALADAEIALAKLLADPAIPAKTKTQVLIPAAQKKIETCEQALEEAETERKQHRTKLPASQIDPAATRAVLHIRRRCLQLVLRLLAANAEHYLARHLYAYLQDDDEYRAITRETIIRGSAAPSPTRPRRSPSRSTSPARIASPALSPCSSPRSTTARRRYPATACPSPTPSGHSDCVVTTPECRRSVTALRSRSWQLKLLDAGGFQPEISSFRLHLAAEGKAARTVRTCTEAVQWFAAARLAREAGRRPVWEDVRRQDVQGWIAWLLRTARRMPAASSAPCSSSSSGSPPRSRSRTRWPG